MEKGLLDYLRWRFIRFNIPKYHKYCQQWLDNVLDKNLWYYRKEMNNLINTGIYKVSNSQNK